MWSKILPFVLFIWALTGAFYPAVDLCAGEKERGTLETLLSSPALRIEIVWGKLLTVMTFSIATALLNLTSLGLTARYVMAQLSQLPIGRCRRGAAACRRWRRCCGWWWRWCRCRPCSARCAWRCAAFARSTKEGQYYLMPLFLISMPLMMLPMAPGTELNLGNSLIPITGVVLLVMSLVQGDYAEALRYVVPVCARDAGLLPLGHSLGRVSIQPGVGAVPRERAARPAAVAGALGARSAGYAVAGRGVFLRGADLRDSVLHAAGDYGQRAGESRFQLSWRSRCSSAKSCALRCPRC